MGPCCQKAAGLFFLTIGEKLATKMTVLHAFFIWQKFFRGYYMPDRGKKRVVFACSDDREFYNDAVQHAKAKFPGQRVYLRADFGSIFEIVRFSGNLSNHPAIRFMMKHGIDEASAYNHQDCAAYVEEIMGMPLARERIYHVNDLRLFFQRVKVEAIPTFKADLNFQELDEIGMHVAVTRSIEQDPRIIIV